MKTLGKNVLNRNLLSFAFILNQSNAKLSLKMSSKTTTNKCQCYLQHISENLWLASLGIFNQKSLEKSILTETDKNMKYPSDEKLPYLKVPLHGAINKIQRFFCHSPICSFFSFSNIVLNVLTLTPCLGKLREKNISKTWNETSVNRNKWKRQKISRRFHLIWQD